MGPKDVHSLLSVEEEALAVAFRKHTLLPLMTAFMPYRRRRADPLQSAPLFAASRHEPAAGYGGGRPKKRFKTYPIGYFHIGRGSYRGRPAYLFVAVDRTSKGPCRVAREGNPENRGGFPANAHRDRSLQGPHGSHRQRNPVPDLPRNRTGPTAPAHLFDRVCNEHGIEHRLTKPNHPWTNGQVERMRTLKEATVKKYHYETAEPQGPPANLPDGLQLR